MRFANYKVFQHLLLLFCLIRNFLLDCSKELDRIMRLGVLSGAKLKTNGEAVEMIAFTI